MTIYSIRFILLIIEQYQFLSIHLNFTPKVSRKFPNKRNVNLNIVKLNYSLFLTKCWSIFHLKFYINWLKKNSLRRPANYKVRWGFGFYWICCDFNSIDHWNVLAEKSQYLIRLAHWIDLWLPSTLQKIQFLNN